MAINHIPKFSNIPYKRPNAEKVTEYITKLTNIVTAAESAKSTIKAVYDWNEQRKEYRTMNSFISIRFSQNVEDEFILSEKQFFDEFAPSIAELNTNFEKAMFASPFIEELRAEFGDFLLDKLRGSIELFTPELKPLMIEESKLVQEFTQVFASGKIEFEGKEYTYSGIGKVLHDNDRERRKQATTARLAFLEKNGEKFDTLYSALVNVRVKKAQASGFDSYIDRRYKEMQRTEYNREDVAQFREYIHEFALPLAQKLRAEQQERIDVEKIRIYDEGVFFNDGNAEPLGDADWMLDKTRSMYHELSDSVPNSDDIRTFIDKLLDNEFLDVENRPRKVGGGYCTTLPQYAMPFIFANFNGTDGDVRVLTHEAGHALQTYLCQQKYEMLEFNFPTLEACEIHSMSMEYITWPWMHEFFGESVDKFKSMHLQKGIFTLLYACAVDEFQHWVFDHPDATATERKETWKSLEAKYMPDRDYDGISFGEQGGIWQQQKHIYASPFYYIDYVLAEICAMQMWVRHEQDRATALHDYLHICRVGGSKPFLEIVREAGLDSPFEKETIQRIMTHLQDWFVKNASK
jgi:M3 family oligoendopeptidase